MNAYDEQRKNMKVYAMLGVPPEIQAYAMARYSRSSRSLLESIADLSEQRTEEFLNTFYFQYGHRSIADLAHIALAIEHVSILAAAKIVDEQLWDGQERSTRYQPFMKTGYFVPPELVEHDAEHYRRACDRLFRTYEALTADLTGLLRGSIPQPSAMDDATFSRTLRARAFDVSRSLLPLATITSLGQVVSARVLERQISRLLSDRFPEVQEVGRALRRSCVEPAIMPFANKGSTEPIRAAPTLVKYAESNPFLIASRQTLRALAREILSSTEEPDRSKAVELADEESLLDEAVATLIYSADDRGHSYRQIQSAVRILPESRKQEVLDAGSLHRGRKDELLRQLQVGYALKFDILMDYGSFRDLHRHRRCVQIIQEPTPNHGAEPASEVFPLAYGTEIATQALQAGLGARYDAALADAHASTTKLDNLPDVAPYVMPLAFRTRALFKMDAAQAVYMIELRSAPAGHFSYRRIAWLMFEALRERAPELAALARATDPFKEQDLLKR